MATSRRSRELPAGQAVWTTEVSGSDFGIPLVTPAHGVRAVRVDRVVRNAVRCRGGTVVWFTDGTKSPALHGRTVWVLVETADPREDTA